LNLLKIENGSCANFVLIVDNECYITNIGDSRAILSYNSGQNVEQLTRDHKPSREDEAVRILVNGGELYSRDNLNEVRKYNSMNDMKRFYNKNILRVYPSGLSISRSFGDIKSKFRKFNGNVKDVICEPEIF